MSTARSTPRGATSSVPIGDWVVDTARSSVRFTLRHMLFTTVHGRFTEFSGTLSVSERGVRAGGRVRAASVDTGDAVRDSHLRDSPDFFGVEGDPEIVFDSSRIEDLGGGRVLVVGDLQMRGITRAIELGGEMSRAGEGRDEHIELSSMARSSEGIRDHLEPDPGHRRRYARRSREDRARNHALEGGGPLSCDARGRPRLPLPHGEVRAARPPAAGAVNERENDAHSLTLLSRRSGSAVALRHRGRGPAGPAAGRTRAGPRLPPHRLHPRPRRRSAGRIHDLGNRIRRLPAAPDRRHVLLPDGHGAHRKGGGPAPRRPSNLPARARPRAPRAPPRGRSGSALGVVAFGKEQVPEETTIEPFYAPGGGVEFFTAGHNPVSLEIFSSGHFVPVGTAAARPGAARLTDPARGNGPGAPDASVERISVKVGSAIRKGGRGDLLRDAAEHVPEGGLHGPLGTDLRRPRRARQRTVTVSYRALCPRPRGAAMMSDLRDGGSGIRTGPAGRVHAEAVRARDVARGADGAASPRWAPTPGATSAVEGWFVAWLDRARLPRRPERRQRPRQHRARARAAARRSGCS